MIEDIKLAIKEGRELTEAQILSIFAYVGNNGDVIMYKNDGLRTVDKFTVVISSSSEKFLSIRNDSSSLSSALSICLERYFLIKNNFHN